MVWRAARSIDRSVGLGAEILATNPGSTLYFVGDSSHATTGHYPAAGASDHNTCSCHGVVCAVDVMKSGGPDLQKLADTLARAARTDGRLKYVIYNHRICSGPNQGHLAGVWRGYGGSNPHVDHVHLSVNHPPSSFDNPAGWGWQASPVPAPPPAPATAPPFPYPADHYLGIESRSPRCHSGRNAADRPKVAQWQNQMRHRGWHLAVDGLFGPASAAAAAKFQREKRLPADSKVGPVTWRATWTSPIS